MAGKIRIMHIEKSGIIEEQDLRKSFHIMFEFINKFSKLNYNTYKKFIFLFPLVLFFAILKSFDEASNSFFNEFWFVFLFLCIVLGLPLYILKKRQKNQESYLERNILIYMDSFDKAYTYFFSDDFVFFKLGDIETKYPIRFLKNCYVYKRYLILEFKDHFNQLLSFSFDSFTEEEFETVYNFLKEKNLIVTKYDDIPSKKI